MEEENEFNEEDKDFESNEEFIEFCKVFDESDKDLFEKVRFKLGTDFKKGFGHNTIFNLKAFRNGTLEALERTRRDLSCTSAEKIIDILYTVGYSTKRIIYMLWKLGYENISFRDLRRYISNDKGRLKEEQQKYMAELEQKKIGLFQDAQQEVLQAENRTLRLYLKLIAKYQNELENITDPANTERLKTNRIIASINDLQAKVDEMHAITKKRDATVEINTQVELTRQLAELEAKPVDGTEQTQSLPSGERMLD